MALRINAKGFVIRFNSLVTFLTLWGLFSSPAKAVDTFWNNTGTGPWQDGANWDTGNAPTTDDNARIQDGGTAILGSDSSVNLVFVNNGRVNHAFQKTLEVNNWLEVAEAPDHNGTYNLAGTLTLGNAGNGDVQVGRGGVANLNVAIRGVLDNTSAAEGGNFYLGTNAGANGTVTSRGTINNKNELIVGFQGDGKLNVNGGSVTAGGPMFVSKENGSTGVVNQNGGNVNAAWVNIGSVGADHNDLNGTYNLSRGTLTTVAAKLAVGVDGTGVFNQSGGTVNVGGEWVQIGGEGAGRTGTGIYNISGGNLNSPRDINVGRGGTGTFTQTDGTVNVGLHADGGNLVLAEPDFGTGTYTLAGGLLKFNNGGRTIINSNAGSSFEFTGGTLLNAAEITGGLTQSGGTIAPGMPLGQTLVTGDYTLSGGGYEAEIGSSGENDLLQVSGNATIDTGTTLKISLLGEFMPSLGEEFAVMSASGGISGMFETVDESMAALADGLTWEIASGANDIVLRVVPEPSSMLLAFLSGLSLLALRIRR